MTTTDAVKKEPVLTLGEFHDIPISGIAMFRGMPHSYAMFDGQHDSYSSCYFLCPIPPRRLKLLLESWEIFERYITASLAGTLSEEDKENFGSLRENDQKNEIEKFMKEIDSASKNKEFCIQVTATFDPVDPVLLHKPNAVAWKSIMGVGSLYFQKLLDCHSARTPLQNLKGIEPHYADCCLIFL